MADKAESIKELEAKHGYKAVGTGLAAWLFEMSDDWVRQEAEGDGLENT